MNVDYILDLHGIPHSEVENKVIRFIEESFDKKRLIKIITGHSETMRVLCLKIINQYDLNFRLPDETSIIIWT